PPPRWTRVFSAGRASAARSRTNLPAMRSTRRARPSYPPHPNPPKNSIAHPYDRTGPVMPLDLDIDQIRGWVAEAGQLALSYFGHVTAEWKGVADPVTEADRAIERLLSGYLREAYPQHGILGEEYGGETL